jgi:uncharacterized protein
MGRSAAGPGPSALPAADGHTEDGNRDFGPCSPIDRFVHVVPVNFVLHEDTIVFRSGYGTKLRLLGSGRASFQVDDIDAGSRAGWSVLVQARAEEVAAREIEGASVDPFVPDDKSHWVRLVPITVSGRRIRLADLSPFDRHAYL